MMNCMNPQVKNPESLNTLNDCLLYAIDRLEQSDVFYGHGTDNAVDEAIFLVMRSFGILPEVDEDWRQSYDESVLSRSVTEAEQHRLVSILDRRINEHIPAAYLLNEAWFAGKPYFVDERVLIPRSPIAELIRSHFLPWMQHPPKRILDLCTGSGCIAIACAHAFPEAQVDATDLSADALAVAKINVAQHQLQDRVRLIQSDLFQDVHDCYDLIVSNPPYVSAAEIQTLPSEYHHEPEMGLDGFDEDGLALVDSMLNSYMQYLNNPGILVVEVGFSESALIQRYPDMPFTWLHFDAGGQGVFLLEK